MVQHSHTGQSCIPDTRRQRGPEAAPVLSVVVPGQELHMTSSNTCPPPTMTSGRPLSSLRLFKLAGNGQGPERRSSTGRMFKPTQNPIQRREGTLLVPGLCSRYDYLLSQYSDAIPHPKSMRLQRGAWSGIHQPPCEWKC